MSEAHAALICANHPDRETTLRCNRCTKPICSSCAVLTPVGYRCRECVRGQQAAFETAFRRDFAAAFLVATVGVGVATALLALIGFWGLLIAPAVGGGLAEAVRWAVRRRRSRLLPRVTLLGGVLGLLPNVILPAVQLLSLFGSRTDVSLLGGIGLNLMWPMAYGLLMIGTMYARVRGIRL